MYGGEVVDSRSSVPPADRYDRSSRARVRAGPRAPDEAKKRAAKGERVLIHEPHQRWPRPHPLPQGARLAVASGFIGARRFERVTILREIREGGRSNAGRV